MRGEKISIDSTKGGNGDIWMRLVSFYAVSVLLPGYKFCIYIPPFLRNLAEFAFGDRLTIIAGNDNTADLTYTNLGIKDLIKPILQGSKFISPYQRSVFNDKKQKQVKDYINKVVFNIADWIGVVQVPSSRYITAYQGYLDIIGIKKIRSVGYDAYVNQLREDYHFLIQKFHGNLPVSQELIIPADLKDKVLFFPTGTSRQFVPVWWAVKYMPDAYYAFFHRDEDRIAFEEAGLKVVNFYKEPGDIIALSYNAKWTISTDSFPSHLLQYANSNCTIALTEVLQSRIISPVFEGKVADSLAPCHPCLHLARKVQPFCAAGYTECINWKNSGYTNAILNSCN